MNIKWNGKGEFSGEFSKPSLRLAQEIHRRGPAPQLTDMFQLMKKDGDFSSIGPDNDLSLICECDCGNILEAPLMKGSKQCCADSLKQMMYDWLVDNQDSLNIDGDFDLLRWAVWLQDWIEQFNAKKKIPRITEWSSEEIHRTIFMPDAFKISIPFSAKKGDRDGPEENKTDRRVD